MTPDLRGYDHIIVALSDGKDSVASLLAALELEARPESIELGHQDVDGGGEGKPGRRLRFPQVSGNLAVRWCSSVAKIGVAAMALRGHDRFLGRRPLFITGERAEESPGLACYAVFEPHMSVPSAARYGATST